MVGTPGDVNLMRAMIDDTRSFHFDLRGAKRLEEALAIIGESPPDIVLLDLGLPDSCGIGTLERMLDHVPNVPIVVLTGTSNGELGVLAVSLGAQDYLVKGDVNAAVLERSISYAIQRMWTLVSCGEQ